MTRTLSELLAPDSALPLLQRAAELSSVEVAVLDRKVLAGEEALIALQVTTRSYLGAVAYGTGGLLVDHGWLRVLGAGCVRFPRSIPGWNGLAGERRFPAGLLVADDAVGGFFAWMAETATIAYLGPDTLRWEDLGQGYEVWLSSMLDGAVTELYADLRWPGWEREVSELSPDQTLHFYPPLFTREGRDAVASSRRPVPIAEAWSLSQDLMAQLR